jgi:agarase
VNAIIALDSNAKPGAPAYDVTKQYSSMDAWADTALGRIRNWGFNAVCCWSSDYTFKKDFPYTLILYLTSPVQRVPDDVFSPEFEAAVETQARSKCVEYSSNICLLGYFLDNEMNWYGDSGYYSGHPPLLLDLYMKLPPTSQGKQRIVSFFNDRYSDIAAFNDVWGTVLSSFSQIADLTVLNSYSAHNAGTDRELYAGAIAERYFQVVVWAIRKYDPNHLILGVRFGGSAPAEVIRMCGKYCDVISVNYYCKSWIVDRPPLDNLFGGAKLLPSSWRKDC